MNIIKTFKSKFGSNRQTLTFKRNFETYQNIAQHFQEAKVDFKTLKNIFFPGMKRNFIEDIFSVISVNIGKTAQCNGAQNFMLVLEIQSQACFNQPLYGFKLQHWLFYSLPGVGCEPRITLASVAPCTAQKHHPMLQPCKLEVKRYLLP